MSLDTIVSDLDALIAETGQALSDAVTHEEQAVRATANGLRAKLDALQNARSVVASSDTQVVVVNTPPAEVQA